MGAASRILLVKVPPEAVNHTTASLQGAVMRHTGPRSPLLCHSYLCYRQAFTSAQPYIHNRGGINSVVFVKHLRHRNEGNSASMVMHTPLPTSSHTTELRPEFLTMACTFFSDVVQSVVGRRGGGGKEVQHK